MSSEREVICRVRGLYAYESDDPSSLSFQPGAIIKVLDQLESGWWDGWSNGKRGWFPSNYVEILRSQEEFDTEEREPDENQLWELQQQWRYRQQQQLRQQQLLLLQQQQQQQQLQLQLQLQQQQQQQQQRLCSNNSDMLIRTVNMTDQQDASDWILQTTEDGSEQYYYNTRTQEMRYSIPPEMNMDDKANQASASSNDSPSASSFASSAPMNEMQQAECPPVRPIRAANRIITQDHHAVSSITSPLKDEFEDNDMLPPNWVRKLTPKGRYYYYNIKTEENTWDLENIDPDTGILMSVTPESNQLEDGYQIATPSPSSLNSNGDEIMFQEPVTWQNLSHVIAHAIHKFKDSLRQGYHTSLSQDSTAIVHGIRMLLYVSQCLDKETSVHLKQHKNLRNLHRTLLALLAKLVLSIKVASGAWPTPETLATLESDADDLSIAVRNFMTCAQDMQIQLKDVKPVLTDEPWRTHPSIAMIGKSDMVTATLVLADNVRGAMSSFSQSVGEIFQQQLDFKVTLATLQTNAPLLIAQYRNLSNSTSHFLDTVEELSHTTPELAQFKQPIYSAMGSLFIVSQSFTSSELDQDQVHDTRQRLEECLNTIESGIKHVVEVAKQQQPHFNEERNTPNPTSRQETNTDPPFSTTTARADSLSLEAHNYEDDQSAEELANSIRRLDIGLDANMSNTIDNNDMTAIQETGQDKDAKIAKSVGEETSTTARGRDSVLTSPTMTNGSVSTSASPITPTCVGSFSTIGTLKNGETPWFLLPDTNDKEMMFNVDGEVKGGSLHCLVQHLTQHDQLDSKFNSTFLLTYRSFCTTEELFDKLFTRYQLPEPERLSDQNLEIWRARKLKLVRLRVFNVIKSWLETYFNEEEDRFFLDEIKYFTEHVIVESMKFGAEQLTGLIKKRLQAEDSGQIRKMKLNVRVSDMPEPILPKNRSFNLSDLDPVEVARQMTIIDFQLYNKIKPVECLDKNWGKPDSDKKHIAANVKASIEHSNQVTAWVTDSILSKNNVKERATTLKKWIYVAEECRLLSNYNTCMAILSAFDNSSIGRLKRTWDKINDRDLQLLTEIKRIMSSNKNFSSYRNIIRKVNPPCIPFLGIYLQDLTFIEDGNQNFLKKSNNLINFAKRMKTAEVIRDLQQYQTAHYMLTAVPGIQMFVKTHLQSSREEEDLYNLSLKLEPREKDEDTIARRLLESGW